MGRTPPQGLPWCEDRRPSTSVSGTNFVRWVRKERHWLVSARSLVSTGFHSAYCWALTYPVKCSIGEKSMLWWAGHPERSGRGKTSPHKSRRLGPAQWHQKALPAPTPADRQRQETQWNNWFLFSCEWKSMSKVAGEGFGEESGKKEQEKSWGKWKEGKKGGRQGKKSHTLNIIPKTQFSLLHHSQKETLWFSLFWLLQTHFKPKDPLSSLFWPDQRPPVHWEGFWDSTQSYSSPPTLPITVHPGSGPGWGAPTEPSQDAVLTDNVNVLLAATTVPSCVPPMCVWPQPNLCIALSPPLHWFRAGPA